MAALPDAASTAQRALRRFARLTNLVLASSSVGVIGSGPVAAELDRILRAIGARVRPVATPVPPDIDLLIVTAGRQPVLATDVAAADRPLIIVEAGGAVVDHDSFAGLAPLAAREGITGYAAARPVFLLETDSAEVAA